jgi:hypothetical protein
VLRDSPSAASPDRRDYPHSASASHAIIGSDPHWSSQNAIFWFACAARIVQEKGRGGLSLVKPTSCARD